MTIKFRAKHRSGFTVDSPLEPFWFPGGEAHIKGAEKQIGEFDYQIADVRGADPKDLIMLMMWADAVYQREEKSVVFMPYLPGARADRGVPLGAMVYANLINGLFADQVIAIDPHSPVMPSFISSSEQVPPKDQLTVFPVARIIKNEVQNGSRDSGSHPYDGVIAPDKGAGVRADQAAIVMGVGPTAHRAEKTRDFETGKLTGFHMLDELEDGKHYLIVDDICDGGGTFLGLADAIHEKYPSVKLDLWATHGLFSKGFVELSKRFTTVHTTNSWRSDILAVPGFVKVHDVTPYLTEAINV